MANKQITLSVNISYSIWFKPLVYVLMTLSYLGLQPSEAEINWIVERAVKAKII